MPSVREQIISRLQALSPAELDVIDDTASHAGHVGASQHANRTGVYDGTHFEIRIVSASFVGASPVARHRMIYALLDDLMKSHIHALKIDAQPA